MMWIKTQDGRRIINTDNIVGIGVSRRVYQDGTVDIYARTVDIPNTVKPAQLVASDIILGTYPREEVMDKFNEICSELSYVMDLSPVNATEE